jgi:hypothetical protein
MCRLLILLAVSTAADELSAKFGSWSTKHSKSWGTAEEKSAAFDAFVQNDKIIADHNSRNLSYWLGHNQFSDLTLAEFKSRYLGGLRAKRERTNVDYSLLNATVPNDDLDWATKGAVTPVKNQAQCGSCWVSWTQIFNSVAPFFFYIHDQYCTQAFSVTGSLEGAYKIAGNPLTSLSEQDLVSCDNAEHGGTDKGCQGGLMDHAFKWIETNGISSEQDYPYKKDGGGTSACKAGRVPFVTLTGYTDVPDESALVAAITKGPVSVAIEADKSAFQLYKGGVLDSPDCGTSLDHGVLAVGYGTDTGKDYYKVKNSWGAAWGESGYLRMVRGKDMCGIGKSASYPTGVKNLGPTPPPTPPSTTCDADCTKCKAVSPLVTDQWCNFNCKRTPPAAGCATDCACTHPH